ncbi:MAG: ATP F0F1 synthase subunit B [Alphaproteobacteria bacterium]|nr:ATP F0F1 synthase subunit B [Alphaproteobacteria bacterium]
MFFTKPEFWVAVSFLGFIALLIYFKVPSFFIKILDQRSERIKAELEEALRFREEAQSLLAEYQRKCRDTEKEAENIVKAAQEEAARYNEETRISLGNVLARRTENAKSKIIQAEQEAIASIHAAVADIATAAAKNIISLKMTPKIHTEFLESNIIELEKKLN